ncbi:MAG TPA: glycosyltransferase family 2 protein [Puia sp.]|nr:glycosyltransferase family 2 protein [Puia sp.]
MHETLPSPGIGASVRRTPKHVKRPPLYSPIRRLSIIIPVYNEASTISVLLDKVSDVELICHIEKEIIVVNDCSKDDTDLMIKEYMMDNPQAPIQYFCQPENQGKGAAVHAGIQYASGDYILIQDADLEYDPKEYNILLEPILTGYADIVYGSRFMGGNPHRILFFWHTLGNKFLTFISNLFTNLNLTDAHTCYKLMRTSMLREIPMREKRFAFDAELNVKVSRIPGIRIYEVGISYYGRTYAEGKKIRWRDGVRSIFCLLKYSLSDRKPISIIQEPIYHESIH